MFYDVNFPICCVSCAKLIKKENQQRLEMTKEEGDGSERLAAKKGKTSEGGVALEKGKLWHDLFTNFQKQITSIENITLDT